MKTGITEQEKQLEKLFEDLTKGFKETERLKDVTKQETMLKELTEKIKDGKGLIKEFEREARYDHMPIEELTERKKYLVNEINGFISIRKTQIQSLNARSELLGIPSDRLQNDIQSSGAMTTHQLVNAGRREMKTVEAALNRSEKVVEDTIQIGAQTAAELKEQTREMERVVDDLVDIEFTMKKARKVLVDLTRGILTDKCIRLILFLIVIAVIVVVVLIIVDNDKETSMPKPRDIGGARRRLFAD